MDIYLGDKRVTVTGSPHETMPLVSLGLYSHPKALGQGQLMYTDILTPAQARDLGQLLLAEAARAAGFDDEPSYKIEYTQCPECFDLHLTFDGERMICLECGWNEWRK